VASKVLFVKIAVSDRYPVVPSVSV